jgi:hypothetical protein
MAKTLSQNPADLSDEMAEMPEDGAVTNEMLLKASEWAVNFDNLNHHIRCAGCRQSIMATGKNNRGYTTNVQTILGLVTMHMIQAHNWTREGIQDG